MAGAGARGACVDLAAARARIEERELDGALLARKEIHRAGGAFVHSAR